MVVVGLRSVRVGSVPPRIVSGVIPTELREGVGGREADVVSRCHRLRYRNGQDVVRVATRVEA